MSTRFDRPILRNFAIWMILLTVIFMGLVYLFTGDIGSVDAESGEILLQSLAFLPILWFLSLVFNKKLMLRDFFNRRTTPFTVTQYFSVILLIFTVSIGLEGLVSFVLTWLSPTYVESVVAEPILDGGTAQRNLVTIILAVLIGPLMEEIVFRGLIFQRLAIRFGLSSAILTSSIIFGLLHFESFLGAAVFGMFMCFLFYHTKNLLIPVLVHILNNVVAVIIDVVLRNDDTFGLETYRSANLIFMIGLVGLPLMYVFFKHNWPKDLGQLPILFHRH